MQKIHWKKWFPSFEDGEKTLGEIERTLPGVDQEQVNKLVRLIENPDSPFALPGAITLERHDAMHIILGRGLLNQDEAFVIGFTMGCASNMSSLHAFLFKQVGMHLYPKPYRFTRKQMQAYTLGVKAAKESAIKDIHLFEFEHHRDWTVNHLRQHLGIDIKLLKHYFKKEADLIPDSEASKRLPTN